MKQITKDKYDEFVAFMASVLEEVLVFDIRRKATYVFKNGLNYKSCVSRFRRNDDGNKSLRRLEKLFNYTREFYQSIIGMKVTIDGKRIRYVKDVLNHLKEHSRYFDFIGKKDVLYKSGKSFSHKSFILIKDAFVDKLFNDKTFGLVSSEHYSGTARKIIHSKLLETVMTKKQKEEYQKEYAEGKHSLTLEQYIAFERKQKRIADKHRMTIAKKAARETLTELTQEIAKKDYEIQTLKDQISRLEKLKDLDSDLPAEFVTELKDGKTFDMDDQEDVDEYDSLSPELKKQLDEDAEKEFVEKPELEIDCSAAINALKNAVQELDDVPEAVPADDIDAYEKKLSDRISVFVSRGMLSVDSANRFAKELRLGVRFTTKDQPCGFSRSRNSDECMDYMKKMMPTYKANLKLEA